MRMLLILWMLAIAAFAQAPELERARELYQRTAYQEALQVLNGVRNRDAGVWELTGKAQFMQEEFKKASESFQKNIELDPRNSSMHLWLGRAYGRRAETSSFLTAPGLAVKARRSFEEAVELDPRNLEAMSDLIEYYLQAPGLLGGGLDKAHALAQKIGRVDGAEHEFALARIAEKREDFPAAEKHLRRAAELAPKQTGRLIDLAKFLARQKRYQESDAIFRQAGQIAPASAKLMFERASMYIRSKRNLDLARALLARYLKAPLTPDDPPRREAERLLKQAAQG